MPNHFHLAVRIKEADLLEKVLSEQFKGNLMNARKENYISLYLSKCFSNFFNSYAKYYNFWKQRQGTLFKRAFRGKLIECDDHLKQVICYIHQNPVTAGYCSHPGQWKYSSCNAILSKSETLVKRKEVIELFDDLSNFIFCNLKTTELKVEEREI